MKIFLVVAVGLICLSTSAQAFADDTQVFEENSQTVSVGSNIGTIFLPGAGVRLTKVTYTPTKIKVETICTVGNTKLKASASAHIKIENVGGYQYLHATDSTKDLVTQDGLTCEASILGMVYPEYGYKTALSSSLITAQPLSNQRLGWYTSSSPSGFELKSK